MSAFIALAYNDRVEILSDGACCTPEGIFIRAQRKIWAAPELPLAVTAVGAVSEIDPLVSIIMEACRFGSVDTALDLLRTGFEKFGPVDCERKYVIVIACVSERFGPTIWTYANRPLGDAPMHRLHLSRGAESMGPGLDAAEVEAIGLPHDWANDGLRAHGLDLFEAMRRKPGSSPFEPEREPGFYIGGHVDHAVVSAEGVSVERIREWPDVPGERIAPWQKVAAFG